MAQVAARTKEVIELSVVSAIFFLIVGLVFALVKVFGAKERSDAEAEGQKSRAETFKNYVVGRRRAANAAEARANAARRRARRSERRS